MSEFQPRPFALEPLVDLPEIGALSGGRDTIVVRPMALRKGSGGVPVALCRYFGPEWLPYLAHRLDGVKPISEAELSQAGLAWLRREFGPAPEFLRRGSIHVLR